MRVSPVRAALIVAASVILAACGSDSDASSTTSGGGNGGSATLTHADGTVRTIDGGFELSPKNGDSAITFSYGPEVEQTTVKALEASGATARVTWRPTDGDPVAASVVEAPKLEEGLQTYEGQVVAVSSSEITIDGPDGERTFTIVEQEAFDVPHLEEHGDEGEPVIVYYRPDAGGSGDQAVAYEDA